MRGGSGLLPVVLLVACSSGEPGQALAPASEDGAAATAPPSVAPAESAAPSASAHEGGCAELGAVLDCLKNKAPASERKAIAQSREEVLSQLGKLGQGAEPACRRALFHKAAVIERVGCAGGRDAWAGAEKRDYPLGELKPLADDCASPWVGLASAPRSEGPLFSWPWVRQTLHAHPVFRGVIAAPTRPNEVELWVIDGDPTLTLFARCWDADTCNRLAAMFQAVIRSSRPTLSCGEVPLGGDRLPAFVLPADGQWLPAADDWVGACARINACRIALDPAIPGNPGLECQRNPAGYDLRCARRPHCREVVGCLAAAAER
jgi:hypothetical protein